MNAETHQQNSKIVLLSGKHFERIFWRKFDLRKEKILSP